jgi:hypothetical protein
MSFGSSSFLAFIIGLAVLIGIIFAATLFARLIRRRIIWTPVGRLLYSLGFPGANGTIYDLKEGQRYRVLKNFPDHESIAVGDNLIFRYQRFIDHAGYVLQFEEREIILKENGEVVRRIWAYLEPVRK